MVVGHHSWVLVRDTHSSRADGRYSFSPLHGRALVFGRFEDSLLGVAIEPQVALHRMAVISVPDAFVSNMIVVVRFRFCRRLVAALRAPLVLARGGGRAWCRDREVFADGLTTTRARKGD